MIRRKEVNENWKFSLLNSPASLDTVLKKEIEAGNWFRAVVPGTIHTDLINNNLIDDPFYADNEIKLQNINECNWVYQTEFNFVKSSDHKINLVFEGLDTISEIFLNDVKLGDTDNMFLCYRYDVTNILKIGNNKLKVIFYSAVKYASQQEKTDREYPLSYFSGRVYIRKAQYSFGWDWGPSFPTCGIWRDVFLEELDEVRIENVYFQTKEIADTQAEVEVVTSISGDKKTDLSLHILLSNNKHTFEEKIKIENAEKLKAVFKIKECNLWWPNGEGEQNLYELIIKIVNDKGDVIDETRKDVGIRKIELIQNEGRQAIFKFRINNRDIFCKGVNWIPADSFLPRVSKSKYLRLLTYAKDAGVNIVRVWGGGIYEDDEFYNLCDRLGLLVWQDFMFACGFYPEHDEFIENVKKEITQNVLRLQYHPSLAFWCGNNENEWIWYQRMNSSYREMPGYKIYHSIIPAILKEIDPDRPYWPSSPFGDDEDPDSVKSGNTHQWDIWSRWMDYLEVINDESLFVTEFGFQGTANRSTFEKYLPRENRNIQDRVFEHHNKQIEGPERIFKFLSGHLPLRTGWKDFIYLAQLNQALALKTCIEHWRFHSSKTNGAIIWQLNDCWPVTSWALIDSELKPKLAYYYVKNAFAKESISFAKNNNSLQTVLLTDGMKGYYLSFHLIDLPSGKIIQQNKIEITINKNNSKKIFDLPSDFIPDDEDKILIATVFDEKQNPVSRNFFTEGRWKHKNLPGANVKLEVVENSSSEFLRVTTDKIAIFIDIYHPVADFSDRGFILLPGEEKILKISMPAGEKVNVDELEIFTLNNYLAK